MFSSSILHCKCAQVFSPVAPFLSFAAAHSVHFPPSSARARRRCISRNGRRSPSQPPGLPPLFLQQPTNFGRMCNSREGGEGRRWQWHEIIPPLCFPQEENMYNTAFNLTSTEKSGFQRRLISHLSIPLSKTGLRSANPVLLQELGGESWNYPYGVLNSSGTCLLPHKFYFPTQWYSNSAPGRWKHSITFIFPPPTRMPHVAFLGRRLPTRPFSSS